jgi:hypothetical protein
MRKLALTVALAAVSVIPALAGALIVDFESVSSNAEAAATGAVAVANVRSCIHPERITLTATAEGIVDGKRQSVTLRMIPLKGGGFGVLTDWPTQGSWAIKIVATHPEYNYAPAVLVPVRTGKLEWAAAQHLRAVPSEQDIASVLAHNGL